MVSIMVNITLERFIFLIYLALTTIPMHYIDYITAGSFMDRESQYVLVGQDSAL